ncbi:helix-turn-helix transcriptional regulator [Bullifex porci]
MSENTLKEHLCNIYRKLDINKFEELLQFAMDNSSLYSQERQGND